MSGAVRLLRMHLAFLPLPHFLLYILHIPELLPHMLRRPGHRHQEVEHKSVQQIKYDRKKKYF